MAKRTIKLNLKLPSGVVATKELSDKVLKAAQAVIASETTELLEAQKLAKELSAKGISISAEELLKRKVKGSGAKGKLGSGNAQRKRVVLSAAQREALIKELADGAKIAAAASKYGISTATVMNIKTAAGLTKKRG